MTAGISWYNMATTEDMREALEEYKEDILRDFNALYFTIGKNKAIGKYFKNSEALSQVQVLSNCIGKAIFYVYGDEKDRDAISQCVVPQY
jgi:hypothetical protein